MKIKTQNATIATLMLVADMAARQRAFQKHLSRALFVTGEGDESHYRNFLDDVNIEAREEIRLVRTRILQYAEVSVDDLINGTFDI